MSTKSIMTEPGGNRSWNEVEQKISLRRNYDYVFRVFFLSRWVPPPIATNQQPTDVTDETQNIGRNIGIDKSYAAPK
jgi:hypothetical protein